MKSYHSFVLIRMVVGFGFGIVTSLVIVHVSEISPPQFRAYSVALNVFMWSVSWFISYSISVVCSSMESMNKHVSFYSSR